MQKNGLPKLSDFKQKRSDIDGLDDYAIFMSQLKQSGPTHPSGMDSLYKK